MSTMIDRNDVLPPAPLLPVQRVGTQHATAVAVQIPRELATVQRRLMEEADLAGEAFYYGWSAGGERIEGASVKLATAAVRCYGNAAVEMLPVQDLADSWVFTAVFVDLETGFTLTRQFRQSKASVVAGRHHEERKADIRFQIGQSKAVRNVVLNALPVSLIDRAVERAKDGVRAKLEDFIAANSLAAAQDLLLKALAKCGVKEEDVCRKCGVAAKAALEVEHLVTLRGDLHALEKGQARPEEIFPPTPSEQAARATSSRVDNLKRKVTAQADKAAQRRAQDAAAEAPDQEPAADGVDQPEPEAE